MITEKEFKKHCESVVSCDKNNCKFYIDCRSIKKNGMSNYTDFYPSLYKEIVKVWRKQKLAKLLS